MNPTESLLRLPEVEAIVGLKKSKVYTLIQEGGFPKPVKLGTRSVRWKASDVYSWINSLPVAALTEEAAA
ncbi:AlpA family transcriptional regulator [Desulfobulbus sp.]|uniref:helix-turn-helix transcriptional regulator n=1 Tax=Desulfobulbus sp. TaxID=895 RepID=UPI0027BAA310|nr:AlpA family transcriptional regulator [Desulfobulbus sp.]